MQVVSRQNIDNWIQWNEQNIWGDLALRANPKPPADLQKPAPKQRVRKPWYQRTPKAWFRPLFAVLLFIRRHWETFALVGVLGVVFGLCWWMTCLWLG